jgi:hypothetical protein
MRNHEKRWPALTLTIKLKLGVSRCGAILRDCKGGGPPFDWGSKWQGPIIKKKLMPDPLSVLLNGLWLCQRFPSMAQELPYQFPCRQ